MGVRFAGESGAEQLVDVLAAKDDEAEQLEAAHVKVSAATGAIAVKGEICDRSGVDRIYSVVLGKAAWRLFDVVV